jgi:hypothetical protein
MKIRVICGKSIVSNLPIRLPEQYYPEPIERLFKRICENLVKIYHLRAKKIFSLFSLIFLSFIKNYSLILFPLTKKIPTARKKSAMYMKKFSTSLKKLPTSLKKPSVSLNKIPSLLKKLSLSPKKPSMYLRKFLMSLKKLPISLRKFLMYLKKHQYLQINSRYLLVFLNFQTFNFQLKTYGKHILL